MPTAAVLSATLFAAAAVAVPDWKAVEAETLRHFQTLVRMDTSDPPGNEKPAADYLRKVLEAEGIPVEVIAIDPKRPNVIARLKSSAAGRHRPLLLMGHTDVVGVQPEKWKLFPPFSAAVSDGYVYGRGTVDDKDNVTAALMTILLLKRLKTPLDRDVIFLAEAGEEGSMQYGIAHLVEKQWPLIEAEFCLAEGGGVRRRDGRPHRMLVATTEKNPTAVKLIARGTAGHGSAPLPDNALERLAGAIGRISAWRPPLRLNDTTRTYFEKLAAISTPEQAARYHGLLDPARTEAIQEYLRLHEPVHYSMLRASLATTMIQGGYRVNIIPSEAEAVLDVRTMPGEDVEAFLTALRAVVRDPSVEVIHTPRRDVRIGEPSRLDTPLYRALEAAQRRIYPGAITLPVMSTGGSDKAYLQARGMQCYGIGAATDDEDGPKGFGAHSDQERVLEAELHRFVRFNWEVVTALAAGGK